MTKDDFRMVMNATFDRMRSLTETKGEEYSNDSDQLANFKRSAADSGASKYQVWLVFFNKHMDAVKHFVKHGQVKSEEGLIGRIDDAILYLLLLKAMHIEEITEAAHKCTTAQNDVIYSGRATSTDDTKTNRS